MSLSKLKSNTMTISDQKMSFFESFPRPTKTYHSKTYDRIGKHHGFEGAGKTVLITGGATGIGYSISKAFAEAGVARIVIVSRSVAPQEKAKKDLEAAYPGTRILLYQASITDPTHMTQILQDLATIDILVLCAALYHRRAPTADLTAQEIEDVFDTNVFSAFALTKAYLATPSPNLGPKTIIALSSAAAQMRASHRGSYGPSKAALTQVMQHFAFEAQEQNDNVRIFTFHPGALYTPASAEIYPENAMPWEDIELPAHFARWLAGPESGFLTGRYLWANWDVDELLDLREKVEREKGFLTLGLVL